MSSFSTHQLDKKLKVLTMSQQSIQTLSLWCIHHRKHARTVVQTWLKDILKVKPKKKLALMYLANDILQNSRRKGPEYNREFALALPDALTNCVKYCDENSVDGLKRILAIWLERNVYEEPFVRRMTRFLEIENEDDNEDKEEEEVEEEKSKTSPIESATISSQNSPNEELKLPAVPPDPDELVRRLQELENSATQDALVREKIANLPNDVTDPTYIDKVDDLASARKLRDKINSACELLSEYNARLAAEQVDRKKAQKMLLDFTACQKYQLAVNAEKLEEYQKKLEKVTAVKKELQSHLENLPDLSKLPNPVPLPSAGDLFSSHMRR